MSEASFVANGPIGSAIVTPEMAAEFQAQIASWPCPWCWGSHRCDLLIDHEDNHKCIDDEDNSICSSVDQRGYDSGGFKWDLYEC